MARPVFKTGEGRQTSLVGSTPTLFRQYSSATTRYEMTLGETTLGETVLAQIH